MAPNRLLTALSPTIWFAVMATMSREDRNQSRFLRELPFRLDPAVLLARLEGSPAVRKNTTTTAAKKRKRDGDQSAIHGSRVAPFGYAACAMASLLACRVSFLLSHELYDPEMCMDMWRLVADRAMDYLVPDLRDRARGNHRLDCFFGMVTKQEKRENLIVEVAAKAVAYCMHQMRSAPPSSLLDRDYLACLDFSEAYHQLVRKGGRWRDTCLPADLWIRVGSSCGRSMPYRTTGALLRIHGGGGTPTLRQFLARVPGFGPTATEETAFSWYSIAVEHADKASIIRTMRDAVFLAFKHRASVGIAGEGTAQDQRFWTILSVPGQRGAYILGLQKDSETVLRYAAFVLRLQRWRCQRTRPLGVCQDLPSYMLVFRHLQAILENTGEIPRQHHDTILRLSFIAIMSWFGDRSSMMMDCTTTATDDNNSMPDVDIYGFRTFLTLGISALFSSGHGEEGLRQLWRKIRDKHAMVIDKRRAKNKRMRTLRPPKGRRYNKRKMEDGGEPPVQQQQQRRGGDETDVDIIDMFRVAFALGRQKTYLPVRIREAIDFDEFDDETMVDTEKKSRFAKIYGSILLKNGARSRLKRFLLDTPVGRKLLEKPQHRIISLIYSKKEGTPEDDSDAGPKEHQVYPSMFLEEQELEHTAEACETTAGVILPPSDKILRSFYRLIDDSDTPDGIRSMLILSLTTTVPLHSDGGRNTQNFPDTPRHCHGPKQRMGMKSISSPLPMVTTTMPNNAEEDSPPPLTHRSILMTILMMIELLGLEKMGGSGAVPPVSWRDGLKQLIVVDPDRLAQLPFSMIPVTIRDRGATLPPQLRSYGSSLALPCARHHDGTWGSVALGLHEELLGMGADPDRTMALFMENAKTPGFNTRDQRQREINLTARRFCEKMTAPEE